jgi:hypothetical protein
MLSSKSSLQDVRILFCFVFINAVLAEVSKSHLIIFQIIIKTGISVPRQPVKPVKNFAV